MRKARRPVRVEGASANTRLPLVISVLALVVALSGVPVVPAATHAVKLALFSKNSGAVNGLKASKTPHRGRLVPLGRNARFPRSVIPAVDARSVGGISAARTATAGALFPLGPNAAFPESVVPLDSTTKAPRIAARVYRTTDLPVPAHLPNGLDVPFDAVAFDTAGLFNSANPTHLTAPVAGLYLISADVGWESEPDLTSVGNNRACELVTSTPQGVIARIQQNPASNLWLDFSSLAVLQPGAFVYLNCNHDKPTPLSIIAANDAPTSLSMLWVAPTP
jgi:hypothetical protein